MKIDGKEAHKSTMHCYEKDNDTGDTTSASLMIIARR